jgi:hypothetical protein
MSAADLNALADRVEALTEPSREVDVLIAVAVDWRWPDWEDGESTARGQAERHGVAWLIDRAVNGHTSSWRGIPLYTASLDAARTLVPEGWQCEGLNWWAEYGASCMLVGSTWDGSDWVHRFDDGRVTGGAFTPALALCAAALRARDSGSGPAGLRREPAQGEAPQSGGDSRIAQRPSSEDTPS